MLPLTIQFEPQFAACIFQVMLHRFIKASKEPLDFAGAVRKSKPAGSFDVFQLRLAHDPVQGDGPAPLNTYRPKDLP